MLAFAVAIATVLFALLSTSPTTHSPELCDLVLTDADGTPYSDSKGQGLPLYCEWTGPDVSVWGADICCDIDAGTAACIPLSSRGTCRASERFYCEYGERTATGGVICQEPFPSMCDQGLCIDVPELAPVTAAVDGVVCCTPGGACTSSDPNSLQGNCPGDYLACPYGIQNEDGTIDCFGE